jgi:hypothetical protein
MVEMLESGEIDPAESPKLAYQKHPLFQLHSLDSFRAGFNKYKSASGYYTRNQQQQPPPPPPAPPLPGDYRIP